MRSFELGCGDCGIGEIAPAGRWPDRLAPGESLRPGQWLISRNRFWGLAMQSDGNLVLYRQDDGRAYWDLGSQGRGGIFAMQTDGNLVMYDTANRAIWATDTAGRLGALVVMQDDGNLVLYERTTPYWQSNTMGGQRHDESGWFEDIVGTFADVVTTVAPFAQTALSFVPGVGAVVNGAIAAGISLAKGESITDALVSGVANALPGGPVVKAAFSAGVRIVNGENVGTAALNAARDALPGGPAAKAAFDVAVALAVGKNVQQGYIAPVQLAPETSSPATANLASAANRMGIVRSKIESGDVTFSTLASQGAPLVDIVRVKPPPMSTGTKAVIAVSTVGALGTAMYYARPFFNAMKIANVFAGARR